MKMNISLEETNIVGDWLFEHGRMFEDEQSKRINYLLENILEKKAMAPNGWEKLYIDPADGRYWELTYPKSEMHGGGPKQLRCISKEAAKQKYKYE